MRIVRVKIFEAASCGGLLDGMDIELLRNSTPRDNADFLPMCLLGKNGTGKSQFLQIIAEIFQAAWHEHRPEEEATVANPELLFEIIYEVSFAGDAGVKRVKLSRARDLSGRIGKMQMEIRGDDGYEPLPDNRHPEFGRNLPPLVVAYTSGDNETLSLPFYVSRSSYASSVATAAMKQADAVVPENRLALLDYSTHLEVLIANLMVAPANVQTELVKHANLSALHSFRLMIQLNHPEAPKVRGKNADRKGVQLTDELERYISQLRNAATCWDYDQKQEIYTLDYFADNESRKAFAAFWPTAIELYRSLHKLAMLNDLMIPKKARERVRRNIKSRKFATKLPEPQDEMKVFKIEEVRFTKAGPSGQSSDVDYVSLSDGEHQQAQLFGIVAMFRDPNTLFLLDEPESHFNPQWRAKLITRIMDLPVQGLSEQEFILTTHAPFVPSDMRREQVRIFSKVDDTLWARKPEIETFGATYDTILSHCFDVDPPISELAQEKIQTLKETGSIEDIEREMPRLGSSVEKALLADRLFELKKQK
ncbi:restriction system-associated AAA family ATPase [Rhizobium bangladeshense]|uniref:restriction system-associated AAA family ATPase n=1 Tax=Rhizobium bangladeshense TaxID=1138189 RepID=UPI001C82E90A|nr:restriction system-associated AAA family ATPase [Rhizobium bangladeshense]MBX4896554.1 restriction system-associated AAA family ATPase [Rhizobium bangladeshense]MBY3614002.1 restriction system-associated AAA family ATPase [Rhizobium bangladeshense]